MTHRRPLIAGIAQSLPDVDPESAARFIAGDAPATALSSAPVEDRRPRSPLTTRLRADYAAALKRASLERQLHGETPSQVQDILEEALGPWLKAHGYLP